MIYLEVLNMNSYPIAIIGGGASGLMAACQAARAIGGANIAVLERKDRVGKKILASGNGRCNLSNINASEEFYHGANPSFVSNALEKHGPGPTLDFFRSIGLVVKLEDDGRAYPDCGHASAVLDVLRNELSRLNVRVHFGDVKEVVSQGEGFRIISESVELDAKKVIIAAGGCASSALGSNGSGYQLIESLGHRITSVFPALVPIETNSQSAKALNGIRVKGELTLDVGGKAEYKRVGEVLFSNGCISGIAAMDLSGFARRADCSVSIDLFPHMIMEELIEFLNGRKELLSHLALEQFFTGCFHKMVGQVIIKNAELDAATPAANLDRHQIEALADEIKGLRFIVGGPSGFKEAQVTGGGAATKFFDPETMESKVRKGLYAAGEILDIYGDCGGYNLQWAWSSGWTAGESAAASI
jgi:predicted Rossmann fold flavoprotein